MAIESPNLFKSIPDNELKYYINPNRQIESYWSAPLSPQMREFVMAMMKFDHRNPYNIFNLKITFMGFEQALGISVASHFSTNNLDDCSYPWHGAMNKPYWTFVVPAPLLLPLHLSPTKGYRIEGQRSEIKTVKEPFMLLFEHNQKRLVTEKIIRPIGQGVFWATYARAFAEACKVKGYSSEKLQPALDQLQEFIFDPHISQRNRGNYIADWYHGD